MVPGQTVFAILRNILSKADVHTLRVEKSDSVAVAHLWDWDFEVIHRSLLKCHKSFVPHCTGYVENITEEDFHKANNVIQRAAAKFRLNVPILHQMTVGSALVVEAGTRVVDAFVRVSASLEVEARALGKVVLVPFRLESLIAPEGS